MTQKPHCKQVYWDFLRNQFYPASDSAEPSDPAIYRLIFKFNHSNFNSSDDGSSNSEQTSQYGISQPELAYSPGLPSQDDIPDLHGIQVDNDLLHVEFQEGFDSEEILPELFSDDSDSDPEFDKDDKADFDNSDSEIEETNIIDDDNRVWEPSLDPPATNLPQAQPEADALASEHLTAGRQNVENQL
ncbi:hypothetical protein QCA50_006370 [Cerrena zonata]|uniref:Uncharacterized protein n=1 Tax=Cerrena zonata TaxID=2478898 RepID=A0AAW0GJR4_9APHY